jgi:hypothetical protein
MAIGGIEGANRYGHRSMRRYGSADTTNLKHAAQAPPVDELRGRMRVKHNSLRTEQRISLLDSPVYPDQSRAPSAGIRRYGGGEQLLRMGGRSNTHQHARLKSALGSAYAKSILPELNDRHRSAAFIMARIVRSACGSPTSWIGECNRFVVGVTESTVNR